MRKFFGLFVCLSRLRIKKNSQAGATQIKERKKENQTGQKEHKTKKANLS